MGLVAGYYTGKDGRLSIGPAPASLEEVAKVTSWALSANVDMLETTHLGLYERTYTPGLKGASGSASILYYETAEKGPSAKSNLHNVLSKILTGDDLTEQNSKMYFRLLWNDGGGNPTRDRRTLEFYGYITQAQLTMQTGAVMGVDISYQMTGDYQLTGV